jgi:hypothetical protein
MPATCVRTSPVVPARDLTSPAPRWAHAHGYILPPPPGASSHDAAATHCSLFTVHCSLLTSHFSLPTSHFPLPTSHFPLPTSHFPLPTSHFPLPTSHFSLPTSHFPLLTSHFSLPQCVPNRVCSALCPRTPVRRLGGALPTCSKLEAEPASKQRSDQISRLGSYRGIDIPRSPSRLLTSHFSNRFPNASAAHFARGLPSGGSEGHFPRVQHWKLNQRGNSVRLKNLGTALTGGLTSPARLPTSHFPLPTSHFPLPQCIPKRICSELRPRTPVRRPLWPVTNHQVVIAHSSLSVPDGTGEK